MKLQRIREVQEPAHVINKRKRRMKRILRAVRFFLVTALFAVTAIYAALSPFFNIKEIKTEGSAHYDAAALSAASGIRTGRNGFRVMFGSENRSGFMCIGDAEKAILEKCPYIKKAKVRYVLPSTVKIEVVEREPAAVIDLIGTLLLIDREGYLLEIDPASGTGDLPVIRVSNPGYAEPGKKLDIPDEMLLSAFKVFDTIREVDSTNTDKLLPLVDFVDAGDVSKICFSLQSRILVNLGKAEDLHYKISAASSIFNKNIKKNERGKLDFSAGKDPVFTPEIGG
jgi:cell division protein FtsQ